MLCIILKAIYWVISTCDELPSKIAFKKVNVTDKILKKGDHSMSVVHFTYSMFSTGNPQSILLRSISQFINTNNLFLD